MLVTASRAWASDMSILLPATTGSPLVPRASCPARSRCSLILLSMYSFRSSLLVSFSAASLAFGRLANLGRNCFSIICSAGSCDKMNVVLVVRGVCGIFAPEAAPTRNCCAAGVAVKKDRSSPVGAASSSLSGLIDFPPLATATVDRIDRSCEITASLRACSCFSDEFSFLVSFSLLRCSRIDSAVGVSGDGLNERF